MKQRNTRSVQLALAAAAVAWSASARADVVINTFDTAAEVSNWRFDYGVIDGHTESFSNDDSQGSATSGSLDFLLNITTNAQAEYAAYTRDFFPGFDGSQFLTLDMDVKVVPGSGTDQYGQSGYFQLSARNTGNYDTVQQFADNLTPGAWRHVSVPLTAPYNDIRALTFQLYANQTGGGFTGINSPVNMRIDNVRFTTTSPPGTLRAGHQFSYEQAGEVDPAHNGGPTNLSFAWGDSYDGNVVDHTQSTLHPTDGAKSLRLSQPLNSYHVGTQVLYNNGDTGKFNALTHGTKLMIDITTPGHGPSYQTLEADLNFGGGPSGMDPYHYLSSYSANNYQFVDGNPGNPTGMDDQTRTTDATQTFTWDFGGAMQAIFGQYWPDIGGYTIIHFATGNGGVATGDPSPGATAEYFLDNVRVINEDTLTRSTWQAIAPGDWTDSSKWANGVPNSVGAPAIFYGVGAGTGTATASATVNVNSAITVGSIVLDSQMTSFANEGSGISVDNLPQIVNYTFSGTGSLTISSGAGASEIYAIAGNHTIAVPVQVNSNLEIDTSAGFKADAGAPNGGRNAAVPMTSVVFTQPINLANGVNMTTHGAGTVGFAAITGTGAGLIINGGHGNLGGNVNVGSLYVASAGIATVAPGGSTVVRSGSLAVLGKLDLNDNKAIVDYTGDSPLIAIRDAVRSGYSSGSWTGGGITSGNAASIAADMGNLHKTAIGFAEATSINAGSFGGQGVDTTSVLISYTFAGDANLDGKVSGIDFNALATHFGASGFWSDADFNYDGTVNMGDFNALAANFNQVLAAPAALANALVPEPGMIALASAGCAAIGLRRRRHG